MSLIKNADPIYGHEFDAIVYLNSWKHFYSCVFNS